jgi:hypothetical protein
MKKNKNIQNQAEKDWDNLLPFYSQWYWQEALVHPYEKTKVYYHGPREEWMNLMEEKEYVIPNCNKR